MNESKTSTEKLKYKSYINLYTMRILHYPRLDTVLMVERFIKENDGVYKKKALWQNLPKKMMYQTFYVIIDYLLESNKISIDSERKIGWIYYPEEVKKLLRKKYLFWKKWKN